MGSRLYGTATEGSDWDYFEIHDKCKPYHSTGEVEDITRWPLSMLMAVANKGGHNALDLLFAPPGWPQVDLIADLRASYIANPYLCETRFLATVQSFLERGDAKGARHAQRLLDNLEDIWHTGRYNPRWRNN